MSTSQKSQKATPTKPGKNSQYEAEQAAITSYEEGWDRWDGPLWPQGTIQCDLQSEQRLPLCTQHHAAKMSSMANQRPPTVKQN